MNSAATDVTPPAHLPPGRYVHLPGRGRMWVWEAPGPPGAPVVVLLHGWTATAALNWHTSFEALRRHFRVLAPDHRGHGRGIQSLWPFRLEDCAADIAALSAALDLGPIIPVGYSMGGPVAQLLWRHDPQAVAGLVLCATARRFPVHRPADRLVRGTLLGLSVMAGLVPPCVRRQAMGPILARRGHEATYGRWAVSEWRRSDPVALARAGLLLELFDSTAWSSTIDVPTAVIVTTDDARVPPERQRAMAHAVAGARLFEIPAGHAACVTDPELFVPALVDACLDVAARSRPASPVGSGPLSG